MRFVVLGILKLHKISCLEPCIVAMATKIIFFSCQNGNFEVHLSKGIGVAIQENGPKRY